MSVPEEDVLKPIDPSIADENQWEEYQLSNVEVHDANGSLTSLLNADDSSPVTVTGLLGTLEPEQRHCLLSRYYRTEPIEIKHVRQFAYGQYEDGELAIWAAGNAGWFKIQPAESYEETYQAMLDAINVFYFVADAHRDGSRKKTQTFPSAEALFEKYAAHNSSKVGSARSAAGHIYKHRMFLINAMLKGKEGIDWQSTPLYSHLERKFVADFAALRKKFKGPDISTQGHQRPSYRVRSNTMSSVGSNTHGSTTRGGAEKPYNCDVCNKQYSSLGGLKYHKEHSTLCQSDSPGGGAAEKLFSCNVCSKQYSSRGGLKYHKEHSALCQSDLPESQASAGQHRRSSRRGSGAGGSTPGYGRSGSGISGDDDTRSLATPDAITSSLTNSNHCSKATLILRAMRGIPVSRQQQMSIRGLAALLFRQFELDSEKQAADIIRAQASYLKRDMQNMRRPNIKWEQTPIYRELITARLPEERLKEICRIKLRPRVSAARRSSIDSFHRSEDEGSLTRRAHKGKSVLRPKTTRLSSKGTSNAASEDEHDGGNADVLTPTKRKRNASGRFQPRKRAASYSEEMDIDMPSPPISHSGGEDVKEEQDDTDSSASNLPLRLKSDPAFKSEPPLFTIVETPLPSYAPQGPGDTWTCTFDGCLHKVYAASEPEGKGFIEDHYEKHAAEERINLVYKEQRPHLPVGNLIKRIRILAEQQQDLALLDSPKIGRGGIFPKPIERRY